MMIHLVMIASNVELSAGHVTPRLIHVLIASTFRKDKYKEMSAYASVHSSIMEL